MERVSLGVALVALAGAMVSAVRPARRAPDWLVAGGGAAVLFVVGILPAGAAIDTVRELAPTLAFLAALFVLAEGCAASGLFAAAGARVGRSGGGSPSSILAAAFVLSAVTTVVLSLDATVVLLAPVLLHLTRRVRVDPRPALYACGHLANSASLLLPISNLTNLLAFHASGLSFTRFAALMAGPWAVALAIEWRVLSRAFPAPRRGAAAGADRGGDPGVAPQLPTLPLAILAATLAGFVVASAARIEPVWVGVAGAAVMTLAVRPAPGSLVRAVQPGFLLFVVGLALIVGAATVHGLGSLAASVLPAGQSAGALVAIALVAAVAANLVNNLPATLLLLPAAAAAGPAALLAMLIGVGVGPNLTYSGSLATLLWRRQLQAGGAPPQLGEFTRLGLRTTLPALVLCPLALWAALQLIGP